MPRKGYGQFRKLAEYLNVSTTFISQVFQGDKSINPEQAIPVCEFFGLTESETEYFIKLVFLERAGSEKLKRMIQKEIEKIRSANLKIANRLGVSSELTDQNKAVFYSDWYYSAIRLSMRLKGLNTIDALAKYLNLSRKVTNEAVQFLIHAGLCTDENGILKGTLGKTHVDADSPFIRMHHMNWRYKALEQVKYPDIHKLHYSSPMTVGVKDMEKIKSELLKAIETIGKIVDVAPDEELMCLNMDWFKIVPRPD